MIGEAESSKRSELCNWPGRDGKSGTVLWWRSKEYRIVRGVYSRKLVGHWMTMLAVQEFLPRVLAT